MYDGATSIIQVNQDYKNEIVIKRGVRQGCPMSMILFVIGIETLISLLEKKNINLNAYADDVTLLITTIQEIDISKEQIDIFSRFSGALLSPNKYEAIELGPKQKHKF